MAIDAVTQRILFGWLRATAFWKVETHSGSTRYWNPFAGLPDSFGTVLKQLTKPVLNIIKLLLTSLNFKRS